MSTATLLASPEAPEREITLDQQRVIIALLERPTVAEAAREVGVHRRTVYNWLKQNAFQAAYREAKRQAMARATARLMQAAEQAVEALIDIINDPHVQPAARVGAAKIILDKAQEAQANDDLAERVENLEQEKAA